VSKDLFGQPSKSSSLKRPAAHLLQQFRHDPQMQRDTIRVFLENGWSLAICCINCGRMVEWTPPELLERFRDKLDLTIADLLARLACQGEGSCGSTDVAVFPHPYDHDWTWPPTLSGDSEA
jgi:hypothetical protein